ncbi:hypothetical protein PENTCL1PPCAC_20174, partial [Pristionchus entomophagus]
TFALFCTIYRMKCSKQSTDERKRRFNGSTTCEQVLIGLDLSGKTIAVTGTTNGIGMETARHLALAGAHVVCLNRNKELSEQAIEKVRNEKPTVEMSFIKCDLSSLSSVRAAAEELLSKHEKLEVLILNAGIIMSRQTATSDGLEATFGVNHVGHFHLATLLLPLLEKSAPARIVIVSSESHAQSGLSPTASLEEKLSTLMPKVEENPGMKRALILYGLSKLCNVLFAMKLHRNLEGRAVDVFVLHPGTMIGTNIISSLGLWAKVINLFASLFNKSLSQGASTTVYCAVHPETKGISGKYWDSCWDDEKNLKKAFSEDIELQEELWRRTERVIAEIEN